MGETVIASSIRNRRTYDVGVQALSNISLDIFFALNRGLMVLIVSMERALNARRHVLGNRSINAHRAAKNKFLRFPLVRRMKQPLCSPNVDFLKVRRGCFTSTSDCRQVDYLLDFVLFEDLLDHRRLIKISRNYDSTLANQ